LDQGVKLLMLFPAKQVAAMIAELGVSHVVWLPSSGLGPWENELESSPHFQLIRVCREGEAWAVAAGLHLGGRSPLVIMQTTGLFESGDCLRNMLFDLNLPLFAIIGHRSYLVPNSPDSAKRFAEPILRAWGLPYVLIARPEELPRFPEHFRACQSAGKPGVALVAEGRM
jgi:phosphonopyruvate decarboxylase